MDITPKGIIIHSMAEFINTEKGPQKASDFIKSINLSVHGYIHPNGTYESHIKSPQKAFHAGKSQFQNLTNLNNHFLGIEILLPGSHDYASFSKGIQQEGAYTQESINTAIEVCKYWIEKYKIPHSSVVRHSDVSGDHIRGKGKGKTDPGKGLDWDKFKQLLQ